MLKIDRQRDSLRVFLCFSFFRIYAYKHTYTPTERPNERPDCRKTGSLNLSLSFAGIKKDGCKLAAIHRIHNVGRFPACFVCSRFSLLASDWLIAQYLWNKAVCKAGQRDSTSCLYAVSLNSFSTGSLFASDIMRRAW